MSNTQSILNNSDMSKDFEELRNHTATICSKSFDNVKDFFYY